MIIKHENENDNDNDNVNNFSSVNIEVIKTVFFFIKDILNI